MCVAIGVEGHPVVFTVYPDKMLERAQFCSTKGQESPRSNKGVAAMAISEYPS